MQYYYSRISFSRLLSRLRYWNVMCAFLRLKCADNELAKLLSNYYCSIVYCKIYMPLCLCARKNSFHSQTVFSSHWMFTQN